MKRTMLILCVAQVSCLTQASSAPKPESPRTLATAAQTTNAQGDDQISKQLDLLTLAAASSSSAAPKPESPRTLAAIAKQKTSEDNLPLMGGCSGWDAIRQMENATTAELRTTLGRTPTQEEAAIHFAQMMEDQRELLLAEETQEDTTEAKLCQILLAKVRKQLNRTPNDGDQDLINTIQEEMTAKAREKARKKLNRTPNELEELGLEYYSDSDNEKK